MILLAFGLLVLLAAALGVSRWRWGIFALVLVAMVQDPVRKLTPGAPAYLVLAALPVWAGIVVGAVRAGDLSWARFRSDYPALARVAWVYALTLIVPAVLSATYSPGSWQLTLLGAYTQFAIVAGVMLGAYFPRSEGDIVRLLVWYCLLAGIVMIGAPLERWGIGTGSGLTGTSSLGGVWVTHRTGSALKMVSGFFRSPDVMGWHAATLVMFAVALALHQGGWRRFGWAALAGWGGVALMFCARRKMIAMLGPYAVIMAFLFVLFRRGRGLVAIALCAVIALAVAIRTYQEVGSSKDVEKFYGTTLDEASDRMEAHGVGAVAETIRQAGFWGHGLGMAVQGTHHIQCKRPRLWQESGPSMLAAELGVPGLVTVALVLVVGAGMVGFALRTAAGTPLYALYFALAGFVAANGVGGIVSAQIFGDPFIGSFLPFLMGLVLSGQRLNVAARTEDRHADHLG
jgi:hypothetical protein